MRFDIQWDAFLSGGLLVAAAYGAGERPVWQTIAGVLIALWLIAPKPKGQNNEAS